MSAPATTTTTTTTTTTADPKGTGSVEMDNEVDHLRGINRTLIWSNQTFSILSLAEHIVS